MKLFLLALCLIILSGCSLASHTVIDVDKHVTEMATKGASVDCTAGFYSGVTINTDNLKIARAVAALDALSDKGTPDYLRCKAKGLEIGILAISGQNGLDDAISKVMGLGLF